MTERIQTGEVKMRRHDKQQTQGNKNINTTNNEREIE